MQWRVGLRPPLLRSSGLVGPEPLPLPKRWPDDCPIHGTSRCER